MPKSKHQIPGRVRSTYAFIKAHRDRYRVEAMCRILVVAPSGYYEWLLQPISNRGQEDARRLRLIRASFVASQGIDGAPRVFLDLREAGETCSKHRVARLMREANLRALHGYRIRRWSVGKPSVLIPNLLQRQFTVTRPNKAWVTDITYIRTWQGWLYLAVVMDLFSRKIVGWSAGPTIHRDLVLTAVLIAVRRRRRPRGTLIHSDQGTQYGSDAWRRFCRSNHLEPSMSRKGNCWDNAVAESFFSSLKKERIKKQIYKNRELATADVADYIDTFYNRTRRHSHLRGLSPSNSKRLTSRADRVSTKSWELH
jgi:putative transposase